MLNVTHHGMLCRYIRKLSVRKLAEARYFDQVKRYNSAHASGANNRKSGTGSDDEPVVKKEGEKGVHKKILEDATNGDEDVDMDKCQTAAVGDYVALIYEGTPYMGEVIVIYPEGG